MAAVIKQTLITNTSGVNNKHFPYLPPFGKTLDNGETYTISGDIFANLKGHPRHLANLATHIANGTVSYSTVNDITPSVVAKVINYTVVNYQDNGKLFTTRGTAGLTSASISNVELTSNVVTVTTSATHSFVVGQQAQVTAVTNTDINGSYVIASTPSGTTFTYALTHADIASGADTGTVTTGVKFTLPATIVAGQRWRFYNEANKDMIIASGTADKLVTINDLAADSLTIITTNQRIGAAFEVVVNDNASAYLVIPSLQGHTVTVAS